MSDSDFIKASERDRMQDAVDAVPRVTPGMFDDVCSSHAAADDVMRDLANYVEQAQYIVGESDRKGSAILYSMGRRLLAKYDRMTGGDA